jgi:hypothetical protein
VTFIDSTATLAARSLEVEEALGLPIANQKNRVSGNRGIGLFEWIACVLCAENPS